MNEKLEKLQPGFPRMAAKLRKKQIKGGLSAMDINKAIARKKSGLGRSLWSLAVGGIAALPTWSGVSMARSAPEDTQDIFSHYLAWKNRLSALQGVLQREGTSLPEDKLEELQGVIEFTKGRMTDSYGKARKSGLRQ